MSSDLLDLAPNSSDAKMFEDFGKKTANNTITPVGSGNTYLLDFL